VVEYLLNKAREVIAESGVDADPVLVGSVAKGTYLSDPDIDLFIRFPPDMPRETLEKTGLELARKIIPNGIEKYAEHPYLHGTIRGFEVDVVPCYRITDPEKKISAVDRTPFHTEFVKEHLHEGQGDEVRLLKGFMKGIGVYGAEARIAGFSGYLCELLIIKYGSFSRALHEIAKWKKKVYLHLGNGGAEFKAPVVFIDPVDSNRNVASAVSEESKAKLIIAAKEFIKEPSLRFFFPPPIREMNRHDLKHAIEERGTCISCVIFSKPNMVDDILYPQMQRTLRAFMAILHEFMPLHGEAYATHDEVLFLMEFERAKLPAIERHEGPPVWTENAVKFLEKWEHNAMSGPYVVNSRLYVDRKRKHTSLPDVLRAGVKNYNLGKYFEKHKDSMRILSTEEVIKKIDEKILTEFLKREFTWKR